MTYTCPPEDLEQIRAQALTAFKSLGKSRIFITGGTGFWGIWLLESLCFAREQLDLQVEVTVLTRFPEKFCHEHPALCREPWLHLFPGDVRTFDFPPDSFTHIVHLATEASERLNREDPDLMIETILTGTQRALQFAAACGAGRFLLASSGAVYGPVPAGVSGVSETYQQPEPFPSSESSYARGKRLGESLALEAAEKDGFALVIARGFAFVGPHLPLDQHFAIGNFIRDCLKGGPILINGDGTARRSYLYASDMAAWLWILLAFGRPSEAYNVGSPLALSIKELAEAVAKAAGVKAAIVVAKTPNPNLPPSTYVPNVEKAENELGLSAWTSLERAVEKTLQWYSQRIS